MNAIRFMDYKLQFVIVFDGLKIQGLDSSDSKD